MKQNGATGLTKGLSGGTAGFVTDAATASQGCIWKSTRWSSGSFPSEVAAGCLGLCEVRRSLLEISFSPPLPSRVWAESFSLLTAGPVLTPDPLSRPSVLLAHVPCPGRWHFGRLALFPPGVLDSFLHYREIGFLWDSHVDPVCAHFLSVSCWPLGEIIPLPLPCQPSLPSGVERSPPC